MSSSVRGLRPQSWHNEPAVQGCAAATLLIATCSSCCSRSVLSLCGCRHRNMPTPSYHPTLPGRRPMVSFSMKNQPFKAVMCQPGLRIGCTLVKYPSGRRASDGVFARAVARAKSELKRFPTTSRPGDPELTRGSATQHRRRAPKRDEREEECTDCLPTNRVIKPGALLLTVR
jgi:hypothetical protein